MDSEDGDLFIKHLAGFVRTHEKALANALQLQRRDTRHRPTQSTSSVSLPRTPTLPDRPATSASTSSSLGSAFSFGGLGLSSNNVKSAKLALTPHHLFYLLSRFEELGIAVGPMKVRLENLHDSSTSANYVSFLGNTQRSRSRDSDVGSIRSVSSVGGVMSSMSALWASLGISASISAARTERQKAALDSDMKYLYSAFTKIPCLRLAPDWRARLIRGYEEFPFDSAVPLYAFKNLQCLEVSSIDFRQFFGWDRLADQLRSLSLKRAGIEDPADILIDIVLDDMDQRRRRSSKTQASPTATLGYSNSPRRGSTTMHHELQRSMTVPLPSALPPPSPSNDPRHSSGDLRVGSLTPSEHAIEDSSASDSAKTPSRNENRKYQKPLTHDGRPRSSSPSRMGGARHPPSHTRSSERIRRSGSGSSYSSLADSWPLHSRNSSGNLMATMTLPSSKWRFLRHLSLADNSMTSIPPAGLQPLSNTLYSLDLSSNLFSQVPESLATLTALRALNLSHCMIDSLHSLTRNPLPAITALNLRANRLQSLAGIEKLYPLERLDLRDNRLTDPMELARLTGIPDLREIWVEGNNFTRSHRDYRISIFNLFRKTPGYTEDILIDGTGPSYTEKRLLVDRVPIPEPISVVKPKAPELASVEVNKPAIVYGTQKENSARNDGPVSKVIVGESATGATKRRKTPKRRIVDLSSGETPPSPTAIDIHKNTTPTERTVPLKTERLAPLRTSTEPNYLISLTPHTQLLSPSEFPDSHGSSVVSQAAVPRIDTDVVGDVDATPPPIAEDSDPTWNKTQDWGKDGETYRLKIQALRDKVGTDYLSVLSEESWQTRHPTSFISNSGPSSSAISSVHIPDHTFSPPPLHEGRTLGQPLSS
ncbi:unnamed protein product [Clonostachys chloroleuca]|uniref:Leucine-rich repeat-containing protein n=1 Tax=Clonostachys chloroleuca TaxID=1926264 RepID=A0AA35M2C7_9HYPO|nr:unnamed protein product [Clonostachys chloroleuca]